MRRKINPLAISYKRLALSLAISSLFGFSSINPAIGEPELLRTLTVTGQGIKRIPNSLAQVRTGVEVTGKTPAEVQQEVAKRTSAVVNLLRSKNVKQLQTTGVRLNPNYERSSEPSSQRVLTGYTATNTVSFDISVEKVSTLLDEIVKAGASRVDGISFTATPKAISTAKKEALQKASIDAREKADVVLNTLDLSSEEIVNIEVDGASIHSPDYSALEYSRGTNATASENIVSGNQTVKASVTLQISY